MCLSTTGTRLHTRFSTNFRQVTRCSIWQEGKQVCYLFFLFFSPRHDCYILHSILISTEYFEVKALTVVGELRKHDSEQKPNFRPRVFGTNDRTGGLISSLACVREQIKNLSMVIGHLRRLQQYASSHSLQKSSVMIVLPSAVLLGLIGFNSGWFHVQKSL